MGEPFTLDPKDVRKLADSLGLSPDAELPVVQVEDYDGDPELYAPGDFMEDKWVIRVPEEDLIKVSEGYYTLGRNTMNEIRHELRHYQVRIGGKDWKPGLPVEEEVAWELDAELKGTESVPRVIAALVIKVSQEYRIPLKEAWDIVVKEASRLGVSDNVLVKAKRMCRRYFKKYPEEKELSGYTQGGF